MTPQMRIPATPAPQFSNPAGRGSRSAGFGLMTSFRLSAACAAAGVLMVVGGGHQVQVPLENVVQSLPIASQPAETHRAVVAQRPATPKPVEPRQPQKAQPAQKASGGGTASYKSCAQVRGAGAARHHSSEPGHRPAVDREHNGKVCGR